MTHRDQPRDGRISFYKHLQAIFVVLFLFLGLEISRKWSGATNRWSYKPCSYEVSALSSWQENVWVEKKSVRESEKKQKQMSHFLFPGFLKYFEKVLQVLKMPESLRRERDEKVEGRSDRDREIRTDTQIHRYVHIRKQTRLHGYTYAHTHIHTQRHKHTRTDRWWWWWWWSHYLYPVVDVVDLSKIWGESSSAA